MIIALVVVSAVPALAKVRALVTTPDEKTIIANARSICPICLK